MSDEPAGDRFAAARSRVFETVKWLAATLGGVAGALATGVALTGLPALSGTGFCIAVTLGLVAALCVLAGLGILLSILLHPPVYFREIEGIAWLRTALEDKGADIFPAEVPSYAEIAADRDRLRAKAATTYAALRDADDAGRAAAEAAYSKAEGALNGLELAIADITSFASLLKLRAAVRCRMWALLILAVISFACLGAIAFQIGEAGLRKEAVAAAIASKTPLPPLPLPGPFAAWWQDTCICRLIAP